MAVAVLIRERNIYIFIHIYVWRRVVFLYLNQAHTTLLRY